MTSQQILQSDFLDILFDNRNKAYGAYTLRKSYNTAMIKSLTISVITVISILYFASGSSTAVTSIVNDPVDIITEAQLPPTEKPKEEPPKTQAAKAPPVKQVEFVETKIVDKPVVNPLATQTDLLKAKISDITTPGPEVIPGVIDPPTPPVINGGGNATKTAESKKDVIIPDRQPQFPGGMQAWLNFLNNNLHSPEDLQSGERKTVNIRFHVDVDGTVTNFQVVQSGGTAFDNEVIRVLKRMPKWTPARQGGQPIAISFTQPVTFVGLEE